MRKKGFTLAELTLSLGIIGVLAAITLPTLLSNTRNAQIGPRLTKAAAMFDQAAEAMMAKRGIEKIADAGFDAAGFMDALSDHLKISPSSTDDIAGNGNTCFTTMPSFGNAYLAGDGVKYAIAFNSSAPTNTDDPPHKQYRGQVLIDINGSGSPNKYGEDAFVFALFENGSLRPVGGNYWNGTSSACAWSSVCEKSATPTDAVGCAGHIFENNFKVLYK